MNLTDTIKRICSSLIMQMGQKRFALVTSVDPATYTAKVLIQPDNIPTGWLPIKSEWIGNGWGLVCPPNIGDQVTVEPHDGDADNLVITGRVFSQAQMPPAGVSGEMWLVHVSGAFIKLTNSGVIQSNGTWNHTGTLQVTEDVVAGYGAQNISALNHEHAQGSDSAGDAEQNTTAPISGT